MRATGLQTSTSFVDIVHPAVRISGLPASVDYASANVPFQVEIGIADAANADLSFVEEVAPGRMVTVRVASSNPQAAMLVSQNSGSYQQVVTVDFPALSSVSEAGLQLDPVSAGTSTTISADSAQPIPANQTPVVPTTNASRAVDVTGGSAGGGNTC